MRMRRPFSIAASTSKLEVDNRFPLKKYYRTADNLLKQANIYREEKNLVELYILLLRFSSLVGETICEHQDYPASSSKEKTLYKKKLSQVLLELENLKPEVQKQLEKLNSVAEYDSFHKNDDRGKYEWPPISRSALLQEGNQEEVNGPSVAPQSLNVKQPFQGHGFLSSYGTSHSSNVPQSFQSTMIGARESLNNLSFSLPCPKDETLSKHSFFGPSGLRAQWNMPVSRARVQYPSYVDASPIKLPSLDAELLKDSTLTTESAAISDFDTFMKSFNEIQLDLDPGSSLKLANELSPPPVAVPVQGAVAGLAGTPDLSTPSVDQLPPLKAADLSMGPVVRKSVDGPKQLYISTRMMDEFLKLARKNTDNNIETCGVLAGSLRSATFYVTALIIPKQQATSDSCQTVNEEEIFDWQDKRSLFQLGWIHTHPRQTCFMSSVDLHTHYSYQVMLPEAIAIVMAPTDDTRKYGIFRLSDPGGIKVIQDCCMRGFHPHEQPSDGGPIYEHCGHIFMSSVLKYEVVDLR